MTTSTKICFLITLLSGVALAGCPANNQVILPPPEQKIVRPTTIYVGNIGARTITTYPATASGDIVPSTTVTGVGTDADPHFLFIDNGGNIWATTTNFPSIGDAVLEYAPGANGPATPLLTLTGSNTGFSRVEGVFVDSSGKVYVVSSGNGKIEIFASGLSGNENVAPTTTIAGPNTTLSFPLGVWVDSAGNIFVGNRGNDDVLVFSPPGAGAQNVAPARTITSASFSSPAGVTLDGAGNLIIADEFASSVFVVPANSNGAVVPTRTISGPNTLINFPFSIAVDGQGFIYVGNCDCSSPPAQAVTVFAPGANGNVVPAQTITGPDTGISDPAGLAIH